MALRPGLVSSVILVQAIFTFLLKKPPIILLTLAYMLSLNVPFPPKVILSAVHLKDSNFSDVILQCHLKEHCRRHSAVSPQGTLLTSLCSVTLQ